ncbi:Protein regulator of cytokinesis 1 [Trichinella sp. T8]|nr:Protein regulator of cytokinesis 1 [Trichinella sp. T8]
MLNESVTFHKFLQESSILPDCFTKFAYKTASTIKKVLFTVHQAFYTVTVIRITKVKWYGPRIAHLVVDLQCKPIMIISCEQLIRRKRTVQTDIRVLILHENFNITRFVQIFGLQMGSATEKRLSAGQNFFEVLHSNLHILQNIWNEMGLSEYKRKERFQNTVNQINNLLSDMIAEEQGYMDLAMERIEHFKTEINALEKELNLEEENAYYLFIYIFKGDFLGLIVEEHYYRQRLMQLREEEKRRKILYNDLTKNLQILYTRLESVQSFHEELKHEYMKFTEQRKLICEEKIAHLNRMWNCCKIASEQRQLFMTSIKDKYSNKALVQYDNEINNLEKFYESRKPVLQLYEEWENLWQMKVNFEKRGLDAVRFFNRGGALLQEEKERKLIEHKLPKIKSKLEQAVCLWNDQHPGELLSYDGMCFLRKINNIEMEYAQQKEKVEKKKARNRCLEEEAKCVAKIVRTSSLRQKSTNCRPLISKMCASLTKSKSAVMQITKQSPNRIFLTNNFDNFTTTSHIL